MKRIILTSLFFCLAITTILAQSTTNIATPNSSGLSDNQVVSFDVNSDGTILNNSASDGTAQLGSTAVTANSNITTGSEANLILFQVTGTDVSDLDGTIEVFGTEAGLIIANPNGITCDGCGFINANRVDLVTGTYNTATGTYSISDNDFTIDNGGLLASTVGVLNIQTNNFTNNDHHPGVSADTFNLSVAGDFNNSGIEVKNTFNLSLAGDFNQRQYADIHANTFNLSVAGDFDNIAYYLAVNNVFLTNSEGRIFVDVLNLNVDGDFTFSNSTNNLTWRANDTLTVSGSANITAASFNNSGAIDVDNSFNAAVGTFINEASATITAIGYCNIFYTTSYTDDGTITCQDVVLNEAMVIDIATPNSNGLSDNQVHDFYVNTTYGTILNNSATNGTATLGSTAVTGNGNITTGSEASLILFQVTGSTVSDLDGTIEVFGTEAGLIIANPNGITCGGCSFINTNRVDLVTGTYDTATGTYSISDNDFAVDNGGLLARNVGVLNIQTNNFTTIIGGAVSADTFNLSVAGDFSNKDTAINVNNTFNLSVAGDFSNSAAGIYADTFNLSIDGDFVHDRNALIQVNTFNLSVAGDFDDIVNYQNTNFITTNNGQIKVNALNLNVGGDFTFSESANDFIWRANDTLTVSGSANITAASFNNSGTIDVDNSFNINAASFNNSGFITVTNNSFNAVVDNFSNEAGATIAAFGGCNIVYTTSSDSGTITCQDVVLEAMVIDIAPPVDGFSNNSVEDFDVNAEGTILNNSAGDGTALGTAVTGNDNITAGSEASLILFQVTGSSGSALNGTIEVFGSEAGLIIANPNGIACNGCAFINANRVDLVTGNNYNASTNTFGSIAATDIDIASSGLAVDVLKIQTGADFNSAGAINTDNLNITAGDDFNNSSTINADTVTIEVTNFANDITNTSTVSSTSLNFILTDNFTHSSTSFTGFNFSNLAISTEGTFTNNDTIDLDGNLTITANSFTNTGGVVAGTFTLSGNGDFDYVNRGTITANTFNLNVDGNFSYDDAASNFTWGEFDTLTVSGNANITTNNYTQSGAITVDGVWTINAHTDFTYSNTNNDFIWDTNDSLTVGRNANIVAAGFANSGTINVTNNSLNITANTFSNPGTVNADTFNLDVVGDFDFADKGTLTTTAFNLDVDGNFSYDDENTNFVWDANDTLTVLGNANIVAANFTNSGTINVTNIFDITAAADFDNSGTITVTNSSFDITATNFTNTGTGTISANSFNAIVDSFINQSGARITAGECNIVATTSTDNGAITCLNSGGDVDVIDIVSPINKISRNVYTDFNIPINGIVFNNSDSTTTSQLLGGVVQANPNVSGNAASIILAQVSGPNSFLFGALEVVGAEAAVIIANPNGITCNGCSFINASRVNLVTGSGNYNSGTDSFDSIANTNIDITENGLDASSVATLNIRAGSFTNTGVLQANTFNLFVDDFDYNDKGTLTTTAFNLEVDDVFSYEDESIGFVWEENDTLTVLGSANINTNNFINHGNINVTNFGSFEITVDYTAINQGSIVSEYGSLNITTYDFFRNLTGGYIAVNSLNIIAGGKVTNTANIDVGTLSITASDDSSRTNDRTGFYVSNRGNITATTLNITAVDNFYNRGNITATNFNITRAKDIFFLNKEIDSYDGTYDGGNISLNGDSSFRADGDIIENYGNIISLNGNSSFIADGGSIQNYGHISLTGDSSFIADGIIENYGHIISLNGDSSFRADGGSIQNYGHIDFGSNNLDISADSFTNHADATIDAATLNLTVSSYIDDGTIDAVVSNNGSIIDTTSDTTNNQ